MKFYLKIFDHIVYRPSKIFLLNLFILKESFCFNFKNLLYIHFFINICKRFNFKDLKNFSLLYRKFFINFIIFNIFIQIFLICLYI